MGAIDVGTNSVHLLVAEISPDGRIDIVEKAREQVELGAGGGLDQQRITDDAFERGLAALEAFKVACDSFEVADIHATATSAVREAENGRDFCRVVKERTGIHVRIINGSEEARLIYLGARADLDFSRGRVMLVDLGGGSTELILCDAETALLSTSLQLGHIRLADAFHKSDPITVDEIDRLAKHIRKQLKAVRARLHADDFSAMVGTSGTTRALARLATLQRGDVDPEHGHGLVLTRAELDGVIHMFTKTGAKRLVRVPGMDAKRAHTLPTGAIITREIMDAFGKDSLVTSQRSLRDGLIADWVLRHRPEVNLLGTVSDPRRRAVLAALKRFHVDKKHARQTARFATQLFDATALLHGLRIDDRRTLEFAALLHDIGHHISGADHHRHGQYLIKHTRMPGFTAPEIAELGNIVRYHRRGRGKVRHPDYAALPPDAQKRVDTMSALLCVADALDRGHNQNVEHIDVSVHDDAVRIRAAARDPGHLERWATVGRARALARVLGRPVEIEVD